MLLLKKPGTFPTDSLALKNKRIGGEMKPSVFIASSVEGLEIAYATQENLEYDAEVVVWPQGIFDLSKYALESLVSAFDKADFGIFVFSNDDIIKLRDKEYTTVRDNVVFEFGLLIGKLGLNRSFVLIPRNVDNLHLPTDLLGIIPGTFDNKRVDENMRAALGPACNKIRKAISRLGAKKNEIKEINDGIVGFHDSFRGVNWDFLLERAEKQIDIVVYHFDSWVNHYYESIVQYFKKENSRLRIFVSDPRDESLLRNVNRFFPEYSAHVIKEKIEHTGDRFARTLKDAGGDMNRLEFYYTPHLLNYSAQCIDCELLILSIYEMYRESRIDSPAFILNLDNSDRLKKYWEKEIKGLEKNSELISVHINV
jgi:predicted nucleotide-binding protein